MTTFPCFQRKPRRRTAWPFLRRLCLFPALVLGLGTLVFAQGPQWWTTAGVLTNMPATNDYAPANAGQLKNMAWHAYRTMQTNLPSGAGAGVSNMVYGLTPGGDFSPVNIGQLKHVAQPFYSNLIALGYTSSYPWTGAPATNDYAPANIGQLKNVFSFDLTDTDSDGLSDVIEFRQNTDPLVADTDHDGWRDGLDPDPKSRAWIDWGNPNLWTNGATCITNRYWPVWCKEAKISVHGYNDYELSSYNIVSNRPLYAGSTCVVVDTNLVGGANMALWARVSTSHVGLLYFQLRDIAWNNLVNNFLGTPHNPQYPTLIDTASLAPSNGEILLKVPMANAPSAANIICQRYTNAIAIYDSMLFMDSNGDRLDDTQVAAIVAHPTTDYDADGLADFWEYTHGFDFTRSDQDGNGIIDGLDDTDGDGVSDGDEVNVYGTDPNNTDTDGDGMSDGWEIANGLNPLPGMDEFLVGWWKFDEGNGTNALNSAIDAYHGELVNFSGEPNGGWVAGKIGGALQFDGEDDCVRIAQAPWMLTGGVFTVSAWAWLDGGCTSDYPQVISDVRAVGNYFGYCLGFSSFTEFGMVDDTYLPDSLVLTGQWVHVAMVYDGMQLHLYRNGQLVAENAATFTIASNSVFAIGDGQDPGYSEQWKGKIDDVRLYRTALRARGVATMYGAAAGDDPDEDGLTNLEEFQNQSNPHNADTDGDGLSDAVDSYPSTLYVGNGSAQTGYPNPVATNSTPWLSAIHQHPVSQNAWGYTLQVATDPNFQNILWSDDAGLEATRAWTRIWGSSNSEWSGPVAVDSNGTIYTAMDAGGSWDGQSHAGQFDFALCKWDANGQRDWTRMWGTPEMEMAKALAVDETQNRIYVAGETRGALGGQTNAGHYDACLTQLDMGGTQQWVRLWGTSDEERTFGVGVDPSGNVYVTGYTLQSMDGQPYSGQIDCFLSKFNSGGDRLWTRQWGSDQSDEPRGGLCVDTQGFVYVVGRTDGAFGGQTNSGGLDAFVTKYSPSGDQVWTRLLGSGSTEEGKGIAIASDGSIYVGGQTWGAFGGQTNRGGADVFLAKLTPDGNTLWTRIWGSSGSDLGGQVSVDGQGNAYVLGVTTNTFDGQAMVGGYDSFVCMLDAFGNHVWTHIWGSPDDDDNSALAADTWGHVYVNGSTLGQFDGQTNTGPNDAFLTRLDSDGDSQPIGPVADGARCPDIRYAGPPLAEGCTNYWRIRFFTANGQAGSWSIGTNYFILRRDTDGDGLTDYDEINIYHTDPQNPYTDGDNMPDGWEVQYYLNPLLDDSAEDADDDMLSNGDEYEIRTNPFETDSDGDELSDWAELNITGTEPTMYDSDNDGINDGDELSPYFWEEPSNKKTSPNGIQLPNNTPRYSFVSELNWSGTADLDSYAKDEESGHVVYYGSQSSPEFELNHDAHPSCSSAGLAPEIIRSTNFIRCGKFYFWYNQWSSCEPALSPSKSTVCITNKGAVTILVNGAMLNPGQSMQMSLAYGGYNTHGIPDFTGGTLFDVTFLNKPCLNVKFVKLSESANPANTIYNGTLKDDPPEIEKNHLYVVESPVDSQYHVKLEVNDHPPSMRSKLMHAVYDGGTKLPTGEGFFPSSGPAVADIAFDHPSLWAPVVTDFEIKVGYDLDGNSDLDPNEIIYPFEVKDTAGGIIGPPIARGASDIRYNQAKAAVALEISINPLPHARELLRIFRDGNIADVPIEKQPTVDSIDINCFAVAFSGDYSEWLTHNAGAPFSSGGDATIPYYTWDRWTSFADSVGRSYQIKKAGKDFYSAKVNSDAVAYFATNPVGHIENFPLSGGYYQVPHASTTVEFVDPWWPDYANDVHGSIGRGRLINHEAQYTIQKKKNLLGQDYLDVIQVIYRGAVEDLYDFNYNSPKMIGTIIARQPAIIQIGHGNGSFSPACEDGNIYRDRIEFNVPITDPF